MPIREQSTPLQLLCEGGDDEEFFSRLATARGLAHYHCVCPRSAEPDRRCLGRGGFKDHLELIHAGAVSGPPVKGILVVADSDDDPDSRFKDVRSSIIQAGLPDPDRPAHIRTNKSGAPIIGVMMVPWHDRTGNLEAVMWEALKPLYESKVAAIEAFSHATGALERPAPLQVKFNLRCLIACLVPTDPGLSLLYFLKKHQEVCAIDYGHKSFSQMADFMAEFSQAVME